MKSSNWMPFYVADYLADTMHLTTREHGAYLLLIFAYWQREGPLPDDDAKLRAIVKFSPHIWRKTRGSVIKFFVVSDGMWHHKRIDRELVMARNILEKKAEAGREGAKSRWQGHRGAINKVNDKPMPSYPVHTKPSSSTEPLHPRARATLRAARPEPSVAPKAPAVANRASPAEIKNLAAGVTTGFGKRRNGPDFSDPVIRKQRWEQDICTRLCQMFDATEAAALLDSYQRGEQAGKDAFEGIDEMLKAEKAAHGQS